jgi:hypothetical protein
LQIAVSRELAAKSGANLLADPELKIGLAIGAINASQTVEAEEALRESLKNPQWYVLQGHTAVVIHAAFSPDVKWVVTASKDRTARVFRCDLCGSVDELLELAKTRLGN